MCGSSFGQIKHKFLVLVENRDTLLYVDEVNPANNWVVSLKPYGKNNDIQLVGNNHVMVSFQNGFGTHPVDKGGFCEFDLANKGKLVRDCLGTTPAGHETSCQRLLNGHTRLFRNNWDSTPTPITCYEFDTSGIAAVKKPDQWQWTDGTVPCIGSRMVRQTVEGTYLFGTTNTDAGYLCEGDTTGKVLNKIKVPGVATGNTGSIYKGIRLQNGNYIVSCGFAKNILELKPDGSVVRTLDGTVTPTGSTVSIGQYFYGCFQILGNGNIVLCNWRGHNDEPDAHGYAMLEYDTNGKVVWYWHDAADKYSCHKVLVLDSVDTRYICYDVYGQLTRIDGSATGAIKPADKAGPRAALASCQARWDGISPVVVPAGARGFVAYSMLGEKLGKFSVGPGERVLHSIPFSKIGNQIVQIEFIK